MSFSDLFSNGFTKRNQDHFAAIVHIAMEDGVITEDEKEFLDRLAQHLAISKETYAGILKDYKSHPINPPVSLERRIERLYDISQMVCADQIKDENKVHLMTKIAIGLGFETNRVLEVVEKALKLVSDTEDFETFRKEINTLFE
ncbi:TerB family tellurite resistance protein [Flavobacteriaceae bacterium]|nr:TerB family tellurite resistance protein [Flavobacteriaceae bacterium]